MVNSFGSRLEKLREKAGYTKKEVSGKLGFTANVYGAYERGDRSPSIETCCKLADLYHVSLDYLLCGKEFGLNQSNNEESKVSSVIRLFKDKGFEEPYIEQIEHWEKLSVEDLQELTNHFQWVVHKAKLRKRI